MTPPLTPPLTFGFILAAGRSRRMGVGASKVLTDLGGQCALDYVLQAARPWCDKIYCVLSPDSPWLCPEIQKAKGFHAVVQENPKGTAHAFSLAFDQVQKQGHTPSSIVVLLGDTPLIQSQDLAPLFSSQADLVLMGMTPLNRTHQYGRIVVDQDNHVQQIVEFSHPSYKDLPPESPVNTGVMRMTSHWLNDALKALKPCAKTQELYLTDLVPHAPLCTLIQGDPIPFQGMNTPQERHAVFHAFQERWRKRACEQGAFLMDPQSTFFSHDTFLSPGVTIEPFVHFRSGVNIQKNAHIGSFCVLEGCTLEEGVRVGPFAHLRSGTHLGAYAQVGNFVEIKNTFLGAFSQAKHLSYLGDAHIEKDVNIGAGVVTCNYDGHQKFKTTIGERSFIGCNSSLIAPLTLGQDVTIGAGSVIDQSILAGHLGIARVKQKHIRLPDWSKHLKRKIRSQH